MNQQQERDDHHDDNNNGNVNDNENVGDNDNANDNENVNVNDNDNVNVSDNDNVNVSDNDNVNVSDNDNVNVSVNDIDDPLVWSKDLERHSCGEFSYAVAQANLFMEDHSQVETGSNAIFVGIYDGHNGPYAAKYLSLNLFNHVIGTAREYGTISEQILNEAISVTDERFLNLVLTAQQLEPSIAVAGSSCLVGVIWKGTFLFAHLGICRAVNGTIDDDSNSTIAMQMTSEHDVNNFSIRQEISDAHLDDPDLVVLRDGVWRIKDITQISRSIGDIHLKWPEFQVHPSLEQFQFSSPLREPAISAAPDLFSRDLEPADRFFMFASRGFWEHLTNRRVGEIVNNNPRMGIARRLVKAAQEEAARKANISYGDLLNIDKGNRLAIHDDMTVVVAFIDHELVGQKDTTLQQTSIKGFNDSVGESNFRNMDDLM